MLQILASKKYYNGRQILNIPSIELDKGVYWLQGINGSGKTTLLRMIAGLIPFDGEILFDGISLRHEHLAYRRNISFAEAEPIFPAFITGQELVTLYRHVRKVSIIEINKLIALFEIQDYLSIPIGSYSSGMIKKLSLLLAFIGNPPLILLDEPLATLDAEALLLLPELIREYHQEFGTSFIFSSHQSLKSVSLSIDKKLIIINQAIYLTT